MRIRKNRAVTTVPGLLEKKPDEREQQQDAHGLINAVRNTRLSPDARNGEEDDERQGAPPETAFEMDGRAAGIAFRTMGRENAGNQQTAKERIKQPGKADVKLLGCASCLSSSKLLFLIRKADIHRDAGSLQNPFV